MTTLVSMNEDTVRVLRIVEYVGPRSWVEKVVAHSIHGRKDLSSGGTTKYIAATTLGLFPEIMEPAKEQPL